MAYENQLGERDRGWGNYCSALSNMLNNILLDICTQNREWGQCLVLEKSLTQKSRNLKKSRLYHRLRKREFPICHTTAYFVPVYYNDCSALPMHITYDKQFWISLPLSSVEWALQLLVKKTFQKASFINVIFWWESVILRPKHLPFTTVAVVFLKGL
jgi:hypothetical protein